tara:strand:- start:1634 stop:2149 length:516 start_codon:yes stop_codon:yes gene_type:complete
MKYDITNKTISSFTVMRFLQEIAKPFTSFNSYRKGIIDENGYFKIPEEKISLSDISTFELFIIYLKRIINQVANPSTRAKLNSLTAAMSLFREELEYYNLDADLMESEIKKYIKEQEAAGIANVVGSGEIAGIPGSLDNLVDADGFLNLVIKPRRKKKNPLYKITRRKDND